MVVETREKSFMVSSTPCLGSKCPLLHLKNHGGRIEAESARAWEQWRQDGERVSHYPPFYLFTLRTYLIMICSSCLHKSDREIITDGETEK